MNIKEVMEMAHNNAMKHGFYNCENCGGEGQYYINTSSYEGYSKIEICPVCKGTGKKAKQNVVSALLDETREFQTSTPSDTFNKDSEQSELCDLIFVCLAYAQESGYDMDKHMADKLNFNKHRVY